MGIETRLAWAAGIIDAGLRHKIIISKHGGIAVQARVRVPHGRTRRAFCESFGLVERPPYAVVPAKKLATVFNAVLVYSQRCEELALLMSVRETVGRLKRGSAGRAAVIGMLREYRKRS